MVEWWHLTNMKTVPCMFVCVNIYPKLNAAET